MVKVLYILPSSDKGHGDAVIAMSYFRCFDRSSVECDFAFYCESYGDNFEEEIKGLGGKIYQLPNIKLFSINKFINGLKRVLENGDYDIIHLHAPVVHSFVKKAMRGLKNIKLVVHSHNTKFGGTFFKNLRNRLLCIGIKKKVDYFFACSEKAGKKIFGTKISKRKNFDIMFNAIELSKFNFSCEVRADYRKKYNCENEDILYLSVARISEQKNPLFLIDVFHNILNKQENAKLFMIGDGEMEKDVSDYIEQLHLQNKVFLLGRRIDVSNFLSASDVFILPSKFEGLGIVLIEAQVNGLMCFASDVCPSETKISNKIEYISLQKSPKEWAEKILNCKLLCDHNIEFNKNKNNYDILSASKRIENIYKEIAKNK